MRTVGVKLMADVSGFTRGMDTATRSTAGLRGELDKAAQGGKLDHLTNAAGALGLGLVGAAGMVVKFAADFDRQMSAVQAATHAGAADMRLLREAAIQAGKDTKFSATDAANGVEQLAKAGVSTADILGGGLKGALDLAAAGGVDVGEAADTAATAMTQFRLSGAQVPHIADLLAAAAGKAQGSVHDMGFALKQSGLVAAQMGLSVEDTTGTLAAFASAGLIGSDAGTSFKQMLLSLMNPAEKTSKLMDEMGISAYDAQGKFIGITALAAQLQTRLGGLTQVQRDSTLAAIFGSDAIRAANVLYREGATGIQKWIDKTNDAGYAAETARIRTDNLSGDLERLKSSLEAVAIESGSGANQGLRVLTKAAGALVDEIGNIPPGVGTVVTVMVGLGGVLLVGGAAWLKYRRFVAEAQAQLIATGPAGEKAAAGVGKATALIGKIGVWSAALEIAAVTLDHLASKDAEVDKLTQSVANFANTGKSVGEMNKVFGDNLDNLSRVGTFAKEANSGFGKFLNTTVAGIPVIGQAGSALGNFVSRLAFGTDAKTAQANMAALDQSMVNYMDSTHDAAKASELWSRVLSASGMDVDQLAALLPNAYKKVGELNAAQEKGKDAALGMGKASKTAGGDVADMGAAANMAASEAKRLNDQIKGLISTQLSLDRADIAARDGLVSLRKELEHGARTLSLNSAEGRKNRGAILDQIEALERERQARVAQGVSLDSANRKYVKDIDGLARTARQLGYNKDQVKALIDKYRNVPGLVPTKIVQPGMPAAQTQTQRLWDKLKGVDGNWVARISTKGYPGVVANLRHLLAAQKALDDNTSVNEANRELGHFFARGGWTGPGPKHKPAGVVHADEFVIQKSSRRTVEATHPGLLDHVNRTGALPPGYADGGIVMPFPVNVAHTKIPQTQLAGPSGGGATYKWIEAVVRAAFPGLRVISDFRRGAVTLTGHRSYHAVGRAVDFPPSKALAQWVNAHYFARTKELITPWNSLNIWNGRRHTYTGAVWRQHNFAGGNAHDHWAMKAGGTITEPIFGVGASGRTYSFGENYQPERVVPNWLPEGSRGGRTGGDTTVNLTVNAPVGSNPREIGRQVVEAVGSYLEGGGSLTVRGQRVL